jgi:hypothetical protein
MRGEEMRQLLVLGALATVAVALVLVGAPGVGAQPNNSEQIVFSGTGFGNFGGGAPFGFWIWCEADSSNPYQGNCTGAMYFYGLQNPTIHVSGDDAVTENGGGSYTLHVSGSSPAGGASVSCWLTNASPVTRGPTNTVTANCGSYGTGTSTNAVVNVTGKS